MRTVERKRFSTVKTTGKNKIEERNFLRNKKVVDLNHHLLQEHFRLKRAFLSKMGFRKYKGVNIAEALPYTY